MELLYKALNITTDGLYETLMGMSSDINTRSKINILAKSFRSRNTDPEYLDSLIVDICPHISQIENRDLAYFYFFLKEKSEEQSAEVIKFIDSRTQSDLEVLWTYADNYKNIAKKYAALKKLELSELSKDLVLPQVAKIRVDQ